MKHNKGTIDLKDQLIIQLLFNIDDLLEEDHIIKHSSSYKRLRKHYYENKPL